MIKEAFGTGETTEEAVANAKKALDAPADADVKVEIVEQAKKKALGIFGKATPAKVRAYFEAPDPVNNAAGIEKAEAYLRTILLGMGMEKAEMETTEEDDNIVINLDCGDDYGIIIGRRGETLDAIQYLTRLAVNKGGEDYKRVTINIGDYREKREKTLVELAHRNAAKVAKNGRNVTLEPMNPFERRIIHTAVQDVEGVTSHSVGSDADRRVVITLKEGVKPTNPQRNRYNKGGRGGYNKNRRPQGNKSEQPVSQESRAPRKDATAATTSRYGKIN